MAIVTFDGRVARRTQRMEGETGKTPSSRALLDVVRRDDAGRAGRRGMAVMTPE